MSGISELSFYSEGLDANETLPRRLVAGKAFIRRHQPLASRFWLIRQGDYAGVRCVNVAAQFQRALQLVVYAGLREFVGEVVEEIFEIIGAANSPKHGLAREAR